ncbi:MAG: septum formation protein Maf [Fimbriimonadaceae bacterium]|nr:septum formation protein Maf [Fimbriimonadaceae bacterium]QYK55833.1 MAG: septum formation protein Maf [Fimbriimonadaceae bacterium]
MRGLLWPVVLASASPRRSDLLRELVESFTVDPADIDEDAMTDPDPWITAQRLAREKALAVQSRHPEALVIGGDTVVALPTGIDTYEQLAKPTDEADARRMLGHLSAKTHLVVTGVCLAWPGGLSAFTETTKVTFRAMSADEIAAYVATGEPLDKAGAYGFQGGARPFVQQVEGSVSNVIGLPMERLEEALRSLR